MGDDTEHQEEGRGQPRSKGVCTTCGAAPVAKDWGARQWGADNGAPRSQGQREGDRADPWLGEGRSQGEQVWREAQRAGRKVGPSEGKQVSRPDPLTKPHHSAPTAGHPRALGTPAPRNCQVFETDVVSIRVVTLVVTLKLAATETRPRQPLQTDTSGDSKRVPRGLFREWPQGQASPCPAGSPGRH